MTRVARRQQQAPGSYYHVMNRGHNRECVFRDDADHQSFLDLLERYRQRFSIRLFHYCLMSNHFHLLLRCEHPQVLSACMGGLLRAYVHYFHRRYGFVGHLWQGRFKSPAVAAERYFLSCGRYIERNPVEAGVVALPWDYRWSSAAAYAVGRADELVCYNVWYQSLADSAAGRQQHWREFLRGDDPGEAQIRRGDWTLGDGHFRRRMQQGDARPARRQGRPRRPPLHEQGLFPQLFMDDGHA